MNFDKIRIIRCKDCTWYDGDPVEGMCQRHRDDFETTPEGFCHLAEMADGTKVSDVNGEGLEWTE